MFKDGLDGIRAARKNASEETVKFSEFFGLQKNNTGFENAMLGPLKRIGLYTAGAFAEECLLPRKVGQT